jgi:hypothetical protein
MRARGANALCRALFETDYGTPPGGNYLQLPFVSANLGEEQGLVESDLLGQGREPYDPTLDVANNRGDLVVPVDVRNFGHHLRLFFGDPDTNAGNAATGSIAFSAQPVATSTVTINGTPFTFVSGSPSGNQVQIGGSLAATITALATALNASAVSGVAQATYVAGATKLTITHDTAGVTGNAFTLAASNTSNGKVSGATLSGGTYLHVFTSGGLVLPSMSIEIGMPEVPSYGMNFGVRGNTLKIGLSRRGLLNATLGLIAQGETPDTVSQAGTPTSLAMQRFAQAVGEIKKDGTRLGNVTGAELNYTNNLDSVETIRPDGRIEDADAAMSGGTGNINVRFADNSLRDAAAGSDPKELSFGWAAEGGFSLTFDYPRVFFPKVKASITGPGGVETNFQWQAAAGEDGHVLSVSLHTDVAAYS